MPRRTVVSNCSAAQQTATHAPHLTLLRASHSLATVLAGGQPVATLHAAGGYYYEPTIVTNIAEGVRLVDEEQFGPALPVMRFSDDDEAIARANATKFGLGGSVWGSDIAGANALAARISSGTVWVNDHLTLTGAPFGGFRWSGLGRELGKADLDTFSECQTLMLAKAPVVPEE